MSWILVIGLLVVLAIGAVFLWRHPDVGRDYLPDLVRRMLIDAKNGGFIRLDDRKSDFWFSVERFDGDDKSALVALRIPKHERVLAAAQSLKKAFVSNGFEWIDEGRDNLSLLAKVFVPVEDIWNKSSGARCAHAIRLLLNEIGLKPNAKLKVERMYTPSDRREHRDLSDW